MHLEETSNLKPGMEDYVSDGLEVIRTKFIEDPSTVNDVKSYSIEFAYQHFGDSEKIIGYKNLRVTLIYSDLSMYSHLKIEHDGELISDEVKPDDICKKILDVYPEEQQDCLIQDWAKFGEECARQSNFTPFGEKVAEFSLTSNNKKFHLYRVMESTPEFDAYFSRVQTLTMFFVERAQYIDTSDPRFFHYFLFEERQEFKTNALKLAGYMSLYRFYVYPDLERARFAHVLILPPYRNCGLGPKFLNSIFEDICRFPSIIDTTVESPADAFVFMRDYVDCVRCKSLPEFSPENLKKGFNKEAMEKVRKELKICKTQCRRIYEILYLSYILKHCPEEKGKFETMVKKRIEIPFKRSQRESIRFRNALDEHEQAVVNEESQVDENIQMLFLSTMEAYNIVIDRLDKYESHF